jgi:hypothetical protein
LILIIVRWEDIRNTCSGSRPWVLISLQPSSFGTHSAHRSLGSPKNPPLRSPKKETGPFSKDHGVYYQQPNHSGITAQTQTVHAVNTPAARNLGDVEFPPTTGFVLEISWNIFGTILGSQTLLCDFRGISGGDNVTDFHCLLTIRF